MSKEPKDAIGLFRLEDIEGMEVEKRQLFGDPQKKRTEEAPVSTASSEQMVDLIRRARTRLAPEPVAPDEVLNSVLPDENGEIAESLERDESLRGETDLETESTHSQSLPVDRSAPQFDTSEIRAVIKAAEEEVSKRRPLQSMVWLGVVIAVVIGTLAITLTLFLSQPPSLLETPFPIETPQFKSEASNLAMIQVYLIPEPAVEIEPEPTGEPPRRSRRSRERERSRQLDIDPATLF